MSAVCASVDPELWFPPQGSSSAPAKALCMTCPLRRACLAEAMATPVQGVWGATTEDERRRLAHAAGRPYTVFPEMARTVCGTETGEHRHRRAGQPACESCRRAAALARALRTAG